MGSVPLLCQLRFVKRAEVLLKYTKAILEVPLWTWKYHSLQDVTLEHNLYDFDPSFNKIERGLAQTPPHTMTEVFVSFYHLPMCWSFGGPGSGIFGAVQGEQL